MFAGLAFLVCAAAASGAEKKEAAADKNLGLVVTGDVKVDGAKVAAGTTLLSPAVIETGEQGAVVHLSNGRVLSIEPASTAHLELTRPGVVQITVDRGNLMYRNQSGQLATLSKNAKTQLDATGQVGPGAGGQVAAATQPAAPNGAGGGLASVADAASAPKVTICHIPPGNPSNMHTIEVGASAVPAHLAHGDSLGECCPENDEEVISPGCPDGKGKGKGKGKG
jgi:hypothetical protein